MKCAKCKHENNKRAVLCEKCDEPIAKQCEICQCINPLDADTCEYCNSFVKDTPAGVYTIEPTIIEKEKDDSSNYKMGQVGANFIQAVGWIFIAGGIVISLDTIPLGVGIAISGLFTIMGAQITSATLDTANNTKKILELLKNKQD